MERQCALTVLSGLVVALSREMAEAGVSSADLGPTFGQCVEAKCVSCGVGVSGADLLAASLNGPAPDRLPPRLARVRLGYCARNSCTSSFYLVKLAPAPGIDWTELWSRAENRAAASVDSTTEVESPALEDSPPPEWMRWLKKPVTIGAMLLVGVILFVQGGCRIPGLSPKPRVFIVP